MELHDLHGSVNHIVADKQVVVHTNPGTKLQAARRGPVAFEADEIHDADRWGWSVVVQGHVELTQYDESAVQALALLSLDPYAGSKSRVVRIVPTHISGREVGRSPVTGRR